MDEKNLGDIYLLTSPSGKQYIGQAVKKLPNGRNWGYLARWKSHIRDAKKGKDYCRLLNNAIRKYGSESFKVEKICECEILKLNDLEQYYIEERKTLSPNGYNLTTGGKSHCRMSKESSILKSKNLKGKNKGRIMEKRKRRRDQDSDLPKYLRSCEEGYRISNHPTGINKTFRSKYKTMEDKLQRSLIYLEMLNKIDALNNDKDLTSEYNTNILNTINL